MGTKIYTSFTVVKLYEDVVDPGTEAITKAVVNGDSIAQSVASKAINGINWRMDSFYTYGENKFYLGVPLSTYTNWQNPKLTINDHLAKTEKYPFTITLLEDPTNAFRHFYMPYLYSKHGYNFWTEETDNLPSGGKSAMDSRYAEFKVEANQLFGQEMQNLRDQVPSGSTVREQVMVDGEYVTKVSEYSYTTSEHSRVVPHQTRSTQLDEVVQDADAAPEHKYIFNFIGTQDITVRGSGTVTYTATHKWHYEYEDGSVSSTKTEILSRQTLRTGVKKFSDTFIYQFSDTFTVDFIDSSEVKYTTVYYYVTKPNGTKIPKVYLEVKQVVEYVAGETGADIDLLSDEPNPVFAEAIEEGVKWAGIAQDRNYPFVPFISNNEDMLSEDKKGTPSYDTTVEILDKLNLDALQINDSIRDNEDIDEIDDAFFMVGVDLLTESQHGKKYLHYAFTDIPEFGYQDIYNGLLGLDENNNFIITGEEKSQQYSSSLSDQEWHIGITYHGIGTRIVKGTIGKLGTADLEIDLDNGLPRIYTRLQVTKDAYEETLLLGAEHYISLYNSRIHTTVDKVVNSDDDADNYKFILPVRRKAMESLSSFERQMLHYESASLVFLSYKEVKTKWYESSIFKNLLIIVAVVITIYTGYDIYHAVAAAVAAGAAASAIAVIIVEMVLTRYLISLGLEYAVKLVGLENAFVIAVTAFAMSYFGDGSVMDISADMWMKVATSTTTAISSNIQKEMVDLKKEVSVFQEKAENLMDELEQKQELLKVDKLLDPFDFIDQAIHTDFSETPAEYYQRTLQTNVAPLTFASIEQFVDNSLTLPKSSI